MKGVQKQLTGLRFGKLIVDSMAEPKKDRNGHNIYRWNCTCDCGEKTIVNGIDLRRGRVKSCGCYVKETRKKPEDLTGKKFGRLTVLSRAENYINSNGKSYVVWSCKCDCGNIKNIQGRALRSGKTISCGCYKREKNKKKKNINIYDLSGDYGICYSGNTNKPIKFDLENYGLISNYYWIENDNGYATTCHNNSIIYMHRLILNATDKKIVIDHKCHDTLDNRKEYLRITDCHHNTMNELVAKNNTSGTTGVSYENGLWRAYISYKGKTIHLGGYKNKDDAIEARKKGEDKYFGEFGIHNSMKPLESQGVDG